VTAHESIAQSSLAACQACHGTDYRGTALSRTFAARTLAGKSFAAGTPIGCYDCHAGPNPG
jgi:nitrate/TMAO reductase-like tetraheme cytochrome c subunit